MAFRRRLQLWYRLPPWREKEHINNDYYFQTGLMGIKLSGGPHYWPEMVI